MNPAHRYDEEAERYVLSAAIAYPEEHGKLIDLFNSRDFYLEEHRLLFGALIRTEPEARGWEALESPDVDAPSRVVELARRYADAIPPRAAFDRHADIVKGLSGTRHVAATLSDATDALASGEDAEAVLERVLSGAERSLSDGGGASPISEAATEVLERALLARTMEGVVGVRTGFARIDSRLGGLQPGRNYVVGARAGTGKSTFAAQAALNAARGGARVLVQSTEMTRADYLERAARAEAHITDEEWETGNFGREKVAALNRSIEHLSELPLFVDERAGATPAELRRNIIRTRPDLVVIDYLQRMRPNKQSRGEYEAVTSLSLEVDRLKSTYSVPLLTVVQLNRNAEARPDKRPALSDLRSSGQIEQDANVVLLLHRPGLYSDEDPNALEVFCVKNRHGNSGWKEQLYKSEGISYLSDSKRFVA